MEFFDSDRHVTQQQFATMVDITQQRVSDLIERGVLPAGGTVGEWLTAYCSHLREQAAGRAATGGLDLATERAALAKASREKIEMQNAVTRGELAPVIVIEQVLTKAASRVAGVFDAIPGMIRRRVPHLPREAIDLIAGEIAKGRNIAASMSLADLNDTAESRPDDNAPQPPEEPSDGQA